IAAPRVPARRAPRLGGRVAGAPRPGLLALRRRAEPADAGSVLPVRPRAGRGEAQALDGRRVRARDARAGEDLVQLELQVLDDLVVFFVVAPDQRVELLGR